MAPPPSLYAFNIHGTVSGSLVHSPMAGGSISMSRYRSRYDCNGHIGGCGAMWDMYQKAGFRGSRRLIVRHISRVVQLVGCASSGRCHGVTL